MVDVLHIVVEYLECPSEDLHWTNEKDKWNRSFLDERIRSSVRIELDGLVIDRFERDRCDQKMYEDIGEYSRENCERIECFCREILQRD